jgi:hypothetical protein
MNRSHEARRPNTKPEAYGPSKIASPSIMRRVRTPPCASSSSPNARYRFCRTSVGTTATRMERFASRSFLSRSGRLAAAASLRSRLIGGFPPRASDGLAASAQSAPARRIVLMPMVPKWRYRGSRDDALSGPSSTDQPDPSEVARVAVPTAWSFVARCLLALLIRCRCSLRRWPRSWDSICPDGGSSDGSEIVGRSRGRDRRWVRGLEKAGERGKTEANIETVRRFPATFFPPPALARSWCKMAETNGAAG